MKKILVAFVLLAGITVVAFASIGNRNKATTEKKCEMKKDYCMKKECRHSYPFSK